MPCAHWRWAGFSVTNGSEVKSGFDYFVDNHPDREVRNLGALKVKRQLRQRWACLSGDDAKRRDGDVMVYGVKWPPLSELRAQFEQRHGQQEWLHPEVTEWPSSGAAWPTQTDRGRRWRATGARCRFGRADREGGR